MGQMNSVSRDTTEPRRPPRFVAFKASDNRHSGHTRLPCPRTTHPARLGFAGAGVPHFEQNCILRDIVILLKFGVWEIEKTEANKGHTANKGYLAARMPPARNSTKATASTAINTTACAANCAACAAWVDTA